MATIQSTLDFQDKMSSKLEKIVQLLETASAKSDMAKLSLGDLEREQNQWKMTLDTANSAIQKNAEHIKQAEEKYNNISETIGIVEKEIEKYNTIINENQAKLDKIAEAQEKFNETLNKTNPAGKNASDGLNSVQAKVITLSAAFQLFNQVKGIISGVNAKINEFVQYSRIQQQAEDQLSIITKQRMSLTDDEVRSLYNLAAAQQKVGVVGDEAVITGMAGISAFTKEKASVEALTPAMNNLAVKMYGYNVNAQNMDMISKSLGKALQGDVGALSRMGVKIDDVTKKRLKSLNEEQRAIELARIIKSVTGDMNEEMAKTPYGKMAQATNRLSDSYEKLGQMLVPIQALFVGMWSKIVETLINNSNIVILTIGLIVTALAVWKWEAIATAAANIAAFLPIIAIIGAVVAAVGLVIAIFDVFGVDANKAIGYVIGAIATLGAVIWNVFKGVLDIMLGVINSAINPYIAFARFLGNVFKNPVAAIKQLFADMANSILGVLKGIARAIDGVFGSNLTNTVNNWSKNLPKAGKMLDLSTDKLGMNRAGYKDAFNAGAGVKLNPRNLLGGATGADGLGGLGGGGSVPVTGKGGKPVNTKVEGEVAIREQDLELLHDLSTRDFAQYYQTLTPQVTIPGMVIHETADVNEVIGAVASTITGFVRSSTETTDYGSQDIALA